MFIEIQDLSFTGLEMDLSRCNIPVWYMQRHNPLVCWIYCLPGRPTLGGRLEKLPTVSTLVFLTHSHSVRLTSSASLVETNKTFREIVVSLAATYGLYLIGSIMHFEPWHMFTCFLQYLFLLPSCESISIYLVDPATHLLTFRCQYIE